MFTDWNWYRMSETVRKVQLKVGNMHLHALSNDPLKFIDFRDHRCPAASSVWLAAIFRKSQSRLLTNYNMQWLFLMFLFDSSPRSHGNSFCITVCTVLLFVQKNECYLSASWIQTRATSKVDPVRNPHKKKDSPFSTAQGQTCPTFLPASNHGLQGWTVVYCTLPRKGAASKA